MKRFIAFLVLALFALGMGLMVVSCGARKKSTIETTIETVKKDTLSTVATTSGSTDTQVAVQEKTTQKETAKEIQAEVKEGEELRVDEFDKDGKLKGSTVFKGSGKAVVKEVEKNQASAKNTQASIIENNQSTASTNASYVENTQVKNSEMNLDRKESFTWSLLWIVLAGLVVFVIYDVMKRRI